ncbi:hypothetical protein EVAR_97210_1 [Eumeta japonica]|uniref:Uncharacterized protein n=1 Tax=Eumeta variegata TaxID=151549 RepID=A0A4C1WFS0_EUMVA|nr:hypothetical protein EVAR_97210_1 [Eumeta japonica]
MTSIEINGVSKFRDRSPIEPSELMDVSAIDATWRRSKLTEERSRIVVRASGGRASDRSGRGGSPLA